MEENDRETIVEHNLDEIIWITYDGFLGEILGWIFAPFLGKPHREVPINKYRLKPYIGTIGGIIYEIHKRSVESLE